jgi:RNA polymerase subunit RPABC4/transcription elongation factor Spt4
MLDALWSLLGICRHRRYTFPQSDKVTKQATVCCLDCGRRLTYDWEGMRVVNPDKKKSAEPTIEATNAITR